MAWTPILSLPGGNKTCYSFPMNKETIKYILMQFHERQLPETRPRKLQLPLGTRKVVTLVGIRRVGKTFLLFDTMRRLLAQGVDKRQILYLNFEDDRLLPLDVGDFDLILRAHDELFPGFIDKKRYLFFDEVQNAPSWESYIRRLHDTEKADIFVTGSSSQLLSRELATGLRGRSISYEVFPLSFAEFLDFRAIEFTPYSAKSESEVTAAFNEYLELGGLPEVVLAEPFVRHRILKEYADLIFYRDLIERYNLTNAQLMRRLLQYCLTNTATLFNTNKIYNDFRSQGFALSKDTLYKYMGHIEESFMLFLLPIADRSLRRQTINPKKLHVIDWSLAQPFLTAPDANLGRRLETALYLHWRRQREDLGYLAGEREVDLVLNPDTPELLINSCLSLSSHPTWEREVAALQSGARQFPGAECLLVAHDTAGRQPPANIKLVEAWRYLLT